MRQGYSILIVSCKGERIGWKYQETLCEYTKITAAPQVYINKKKRQAKTKRKNLVHSAALSIYKSFIKRPENSSYKSLNNKDYV